MLGVPICRPGDSLSTRETLLALVDAFDASLRALGRLPDPTAKGGLGIADPVRVCDVARRLVAIRGCGGANPVLGHPRCTPAWTRGSDQGLL